MGQLWLLLQSGVDRLSSIEFSYVSISDFGRWVLHVFFFLQNQLHSIAFSWGRTRTGRTPLFDCDCTCSCGICTVVHAVHGPSSSLYDVTSRSAKKTQKIS